MPIKVPLLDEVETRRRRNAQRYAIQDGIPLDQGVDAVYDWVYRPEMQFTLFGLGVGKVSQTDAQDQQRILYQPAQQIEQVELDLGAKQLDILYSLLMGGDLQPLPPFGGARELVFSLGAEEVVAQVDGAGRVSFQDISHIARLSAADLAAIRLYQSTDVENILWEYKLKVVDLDVDSKNTQGFDYPDRSEAVDGIENQRRDPETNALLTGKLLGVNDGDADRDGLADFADMTYRDAQTGAVVDVRFAPLVVELPEQLDLSRISLRFDYQGSDPNAVATATDAFGDTVYTPAPGFLRIWKRGPSGTRAPASDYIIPGNAYSPAELGISGGDCTGRARCRETILYIEGIRRSQTQADQAIRLEVTGG